MVTDAHLLRSEATVNYDGSFEVLAEKFPYIYLEVRLTQAQKPTPAEETAGSLSAVTAWSFHTSQCNRDLMISQQVFPSYP